MTPVYPNQLSCVDYVAHAENCAAPFRWVYCF